MIELYYTRLNMSQNISKAELSKLQSERAREILKYAASGLCIGLDEEDLKISRTEKGKPYFDSLPYYFSISHTKDFVCVALADFEIGVDVQEESDVSEKVTSRFLNKSSKDQKENTYLWTDFESFAKYLGCGIPLDENAKKMKDNAKFKHLELDGFLISVCSKEEIDTSTFKIKRL